MTFPPIHSPIFPALLNQGLALGFASLISQGAAS